LLISYKNEKERVSLGVPLESMAIREREINTQLLLFELDSVQYILYETDMRLTFEKDKEIIENKMPPPE
jgi:hypothetical protein